ncbi:MAG: ATP-binding protein [Eubacteriales bacterium]|nr:ATP-binding protein [Eubacteriales bacterium]
MQEPFLRVTSIANKIGRAWAARLFFTFLVWDLIALAAAAGIFALYHEQQVCGDQWTPALPRELVWETKEYRFQAPEGGWQSVSFAAVLETAEPFAAAVLVLQAVTLVSQSRQGKKKARELLRPIDKMAKAARELMRIQAQTPRPEEPVDLHGLEEAIGKITPGEQLRTGDTELQGLENAINAMLSRMQDAYRQQARFVSDASHELRTPIAVIQGYAGMLRRWGKEDPKVLEEGIEAIASESDYMKKLVEQLLFLARGDTGRSRMEQKRVNVADIIQEARDDAALIDKEHVWEIGRCESAFVTGDPAMLKQCVRILTENAARYTPKGGAVRLQAVASAQEARIVVQDTGCGIAPKDMRHIFERFYRADAARSRENGGSGLGLSIAGWIAQSHGGYFEVLSREGLGTRFTLCLPLENTPQQQKTAL